MPSETTNPLAEQFTRTRSLLGSDGVQRLIDARVCVFGVGGVGGFAVEALARAGVGSIDIVDNDQVSVSNINRQIIATWDTIGRSKVDVMQERILSINPHCRVNKHACFYLPEQRDQFDFAAYDYIIDAIDTVTAKIDLVLAAQEANTPIISSMGAGNKLDPTRLEVADIYDTSVCRLAKTMRKELRARGVAHLKCVYSRELPLPPDAEAKACRSDCICPPETDKASCPLRKSVPGSVSFVPSVAGLIIAAEVVKDLVEGGQTPGNPHNPSKRAGVEHG